MIIRGAVRSDAQDMTRLLNEIIAVGGTTAHETPFDESSMIAHYIEPPALISCQVAEIDGSAQGFQWLGWPRTEGEDFPNGWAIIASFVDVNAVGKGIGRHLFAATVQTAQRAGVKTIDATIRADNRSGLQYYGGLGFTDYDRLKDVPLHDGTMVDRVRKRFDIG